MDRTEQTSGPQEESIGVVMTRPARPATAPGRTREVVIGRQTETPEPEKESS